MSLKITTGIDGLPILMSDGSDVVSLDGFGTVHGGIIEFKKSSDDKTLFTINNYSEEQEVVFEGDDTDLNIEFNGVNIKAKLGEGNDNVVWNVSKGSLDTRGGNDKVITTASATDNRINLGSGDDTIIENGDFNLITDTVGKSNVTTTSSSTGAVIITGSGDDTFNLNGNNAYVQAGDGVTRVNTGNGSNGNVVNTGNARSIPNNLLDIFKNHEWLYEYLKIFLGIK